MLKRIDNLYVRNILMAVFIAVVGFILLNLTFLLYAFVLNSLRSVIPPDVVDGTNVNLGIKWYVAAASIGLSLLICYGFVVVFRSKISVLYKATLMTAPAAIILVIIGLLFYQLPIIVFIADGSIVAAALLYFYKTKQPWPYWYAVVIVALALAIMTLTGAEI